MIIKFLNYRILITKEIKGISLARPTRKNKPSRWSRKGRCPSCGVKQGSRHNKYCNFKYN